MPCYAIIAQWLAIIYVYTGCPKNIRPNVNTIF